MTPCSCSGFLALALIGTPLFLVFGAAAMYSLRPSHDGTITSVAIDVFSEKFADSPQLVTIPLFTIAGYMMAEGGTPTAWSTLSRAWLGWMPGGLAVVCLCTSAFFTTFTGGSGITIVAIGGLLMPALLQERYPERFSLGLVTTAGSLGIMFPPALPLILYGIVANILIDKLFLAGFLPGMLTVVALSRLRGLCRHQGQGRARAVRPEARAGQRIWYAKWEIGLPVVIVGGLATGMLRVHEASRVHRPVRARWSRRSIYRELSIRKDLPRIIRESMTLVGAILAILSTAIGFTAYLIQAQVPMQLLQSMQVLITSKTMFLLVLNVFLLIAGMVMEIFARHLRGGAADRPDRASTSASIPTTSAIMFLVNLEIAYLAPPLGLEPDHLELPLRHAGDQRVSLGAAVHRRAHASRLIVTTYVPWLSTYLPSLSKEKDLTTEELGGPAPPAPGEGAAPSEGGDTLDDLNLDDLTLDDLDKPAPEAPEAAPPEGATPPAQPAPPESGTPK